MDKKEKLELTPEQEAQMRPWAEKWLANALRTDPMTSKDRKLMREAVVGMYKCADLPPPRILFCHSPHSGAIASSIAASATYILENPDECKAHFGKKVTRAHAARLVVEAIKLAVKTSMEKFGTPADTISSVTSDCIELALAAADLANVKPTTTFSAGIRDMLVEARKFYWKILDGGNQWSSWACLISFFRHVVKHPLDYSRWQHYEIGAQHGGPRYSHRDFCIVSDFPTYLGQDAENRPHCETGPSHAWSDGWKLYFWHGTDIPSAWIEHKDTMDPRIALNWENIEQRRCAAEILGWARVLEQLNPTVIDDDPDPMVGTLLEVDLPDSGRERFLRVKCGTGRDFVLPVPPEMTTALEANCWTYNIPAEIFKMSEGRT